jgi:hypothetical protein
MKFTVSALTLFGLLASFYSVAHADPMDAIVDLQVETLENDQPITRLCKGVIVAQAQLLSVDHCIRDGKKITVHNEKIQQIVEVEASIRSNGLVLLDLVVPFNTYLIQELKVTPNDHGKLDDSTQVKMCGASIASEQLTLNDGGKPTLDRDDRVLGLAYSMTYDPMTSQRKLLQYACVTSQIADEINAH